MHGMTASTPGPAAAPQVDCEIAEVRSRSELRAWHEVYCEVFGGDDRSSQDWQQVHNALGPSGDRSLLLLFARVKGSPAATAAVYLEPDVAGLYCFTTRSGCVVAVSHPRSCTPPTRPRKRAASNGRSYKQRPRAGRCTPEPGTGSSEHSQFSCDAASSERMMGLEPTTSAWHGKSATRQRLTRELPLRSAVRQREHAGSRAGTSDTPRNADLQDKRDRG